MSQVISDLGSILFKLIFTVVTRSGTELECSEESLALNCLYSEGYIAVTKLRLLVRQKFASKIFFHHEVLI